MADQSGEKLQVPQCKGMSLPFILLLIVGYVAGICAKFIIGVNVHNAYVLVVYLLNLAMVTANLFVYFRNRGLDRKAELCVELDADDPAMELVAASVADKVQQRSKSRGAVLRPQGCRQCRIYRLYPVGQDL